MPLAELHGRLPHGVLVSGVRGETSPAVEQICGEDGLEFVEDRLPVVGRWERDKRIQITNEPPVRSDHLHAHPEIVVPSIDNKGPSDCAAEFFQNLLPKGGSFRQDLLVDLVRSWRRPTNKMGKKSASAPFNKLESSTVMC